VGVQARETSLFQPSAREINILRFNLVSGDAFCLSAPMTRSAPTLSMDAYLTRFNGLGRAERQAYEEEAADIVDQEGLSDDQEKIEALDDVRQSGCCGAQHC
jgi:hypothetical protein